MSVVAYCVVGQSGRIEYHNEGIAMLLGKTEGNPYTGRLLDEVFDIAPAFSVLAGRLNNTAIEYTETAIGDKSYLLVFQSFPNEVRLPGFLCVIVPVEDGHLSLKSTDNLFDSLHDAVLFVNTQHTVIWYNNVATEILNLSGEQIESMKCYELICKRNDAKHTCPHLNRTVGETNYLSVREFNEQYYIIKAVEMRGLEEESGVHMEIISRLEPAHKPSVATDPLSNIEVISEVTSDIIWMMDTNEVLTYANAAAYRVFGYSTDVIGKITSRDVLTPESYAIQHEAFTRRLLYEGTGNPTDSITLKLECRRADGSTFWAEVTSTPFRDTNGRMSGVLGIGRDISQRLATEKALVESEEKYRMLFENMQSGFMLLDVEDAQNLRFLEVNQKTEELLGLKQKNLLGKNTWELFKDQELETLIPYLNEVMQHGKSHFEYYYAPTDKYLDVHLYSSQPKRFAAILIDITERMRARKELALQKEELQKSNLFKDTLLSVIGHDLKNPLGNIIGFSELLYIQAENIDAEKSKFYAQNIFATAQSMHSLLENLLEWSKSQKGMLAPKPEHLILADLIEESVATLCALIAHKEIRLKNLIDQQTSVWADKELLQTVLRNLIANAIKFSSRGGTIHLSFEHDPPFGKVIIRDEGMGIAPEKLAALLHGESIRSAQGTEGEKGTGLGLTICRQFVNLMGGELGAISTVKQGSTFYFTVPLHE